MSKYLKKKRAVALYLHIITGRLKCSKDYSRTIKNGYFGSLITRNLQKKIKNRIEQTDKQTDQHTDKTKNKSLSLNGVERVHKVNWKILT